MPKRKRTAIPSYDDWLVNDSDDDDEDAEFTINDATESSSSDDEPPNKRSRSRASSFDELSSERATLERQSTGRNIKQTAETIKKLQTNYLKLFKFFRRNAPQYELSYYSCMPMNEQKRILDRLAEIMQNADMRHEIPHSIKIIESQKIPDRYKAIALRRLELFAKLEPTDSEYTKMNDWMELFMRIPFGIYDTIINNNEQDAHNTLISARETLDKSIYGMSAAKNNIIELLALYLTNPTAAGSAIGIQGPAGVGKTTLVRDGISKIMGRKFVFIPLGGVNDGSYLDGHSSTYIGAKCGKLVQSIIECGSMNPLIYFDELDKVGCDSGGKAIIDILIHLIDTSQNCEFRDNYFSDIAFDFSKCIFVFSYNDPNAINPILLDRMEKIHIGDYTLSEKIIICKNYLLPQIYKKMLFNGTELHFSDKILTHICSKSNGMRNAAQILEKICRTVNLKRAMSHLTHKYTVSIDDVHNSSI